MSTVFIPSEAVKVPVADASCVALASGPLSDVEASPETSADECGGESNMVVDES